jgi:hypothetical protein
MKTPVWHCEEYESWRPVERAIEETLGAQSMLASSSGNPGKSELKGLCADCANRDCCTFPKPEGGVWHCSDYC